MSVAIIRTSILLYCQHVVLMFDDNCSPNLLTTNANYEHNRATYAYRGAEKHVIEMCSKRNTEFTRWTSSTQILRCSDNNAENFGQVKCNSKYTKSMWNNSCKILLTVACHLRKYQTDYLRQQISILKHANEVETCHQGWRSSISPIFVIFLLSECIT